MNFLIFTLAFRSVCRKRVHSVVKCIPVWQSFSYNTLHDFTSCLSYLTLIERLTSLVYWSTKANCLKGGKNEVFIIILHSWSEMRRCALWCASLITFLLWLQSTCQFPRLEHLVERFLFSLRRLIAFDVRRTWHNTPSWDSCGTHLGFLCYSRWPFQPGKH